MSRTEVVFVPADPPRSGVLALVGDPDPDGEVEIVVPAGERVRRTTVKARLLTVPAALRRFASSVASNDPADDGAGTSLDVERSAPEEAWAAATLAGLGLVARGRVLPARSPGGFGAWRVGPLDAEDRRWLRSLAAAMPASGHAVAVPDVRPVRLRSPEALVRAYWDAIADTLARSPAAGVAVDAKPFAVADPVALEGPTEWLEEPSLVERAGAHVVLRVEPPDDPDETDDPQETDEPHETDDPHDAERATAHDRRNAAAYGGFRAVLQVRSAADPSLLVDVADLWNAPAAVLARLGDRAESDLLLGLRHGARVWPPLARALRAATPTAVELADPEVEDLLDRGADALDSAGIEVLWPRELFGDAPTLRATATTPTPQGGVEAGLSTDRVLAFRWQPQLGDDALTEAELQALADAKRPFLRLRGRWVKVDRELVSKLRRRTTRRLAGAEALAATLAGELEVDGELVAFEPPESLAGLAKLLDEAGKGEREVPDPAGLEAELRPYQRRGLAWLAHLTELGLGGCLADDMGLGKTLQLIALHLHRAPKAAGPTLVICPATLLGTWQRELERFAPGVPVRRYHGTQRSLDDLAGGELVLTTYGVVRQDHARLAEVGWGLAVADEAQHAKNPLSRTARAIRRIPSDARVALTGTPVENRLSELWSILDWTTPGLLGPLDRFTSRLAVPVERYRDPDATARLSAITRPFLLRRKKSDPTIAPELPKKTESDLVVPLTIEQTTLYKAIVDETMAEIAEAEGIARRGLVLQLLTGLKQVCNHPAQYLHEKGPYERGVLPRRSGKLAALDDLLDVILAERESVLIFSQYVEMARLLESHLTARGIRSGLLHGGLGVKRRQRLVEDFQAGAFPVFLLSLKAGGVGLTLTSATHVVHYDRWWNPAVEDQATDRAYRIGQGRPVQVHRLVTEGTLEDRIGALIEAKRQLAEAVVGSGEGWIGDLSDDELGALVSLSTGAES